MTEAELKAREAKARSEYPLTAECFDKVRAAAVSKMLASKPNEAEKREEIYRLVHILDAVQAELLALVGQGSDEIAKYVESLKA